MAAIGIDIGGTQLRAALYDQDFRALDRFSAPNQKEIGPWANLDKLAAFVNAHREGVGGIGVGCPGPLDIPGGKLINPPNLFGWDGLDVAGYFREATGLDTRLNNDANLAGLAEAKLGAGRGWESMFYMTVSTGIGGAYVYKGELVNGAHSAAAEIYNLIVNEDPYSHHGVNAGAINEQCGGMALARIAGERLGRPVDAPQLFQLARAGHPQARDILDKCADNLGKALGNIACVVDPDIFVLGGAIVLRNPDFAGLIAQKARKYLIHPQWLRLRTASLGEEAGLLGAALWAPK